MSFVNDHDNNCQCGVCEDTDGVQEDGFFILDITNLTLSTTPLLIGSFRSSPDDQAVERNSIQSTLCCGATQSRIAPVIVQILGLHQQSSDYERLDIKHNTASDLLVKRIQYLI
jgi:hypothetical protein